MTNLRSFESVASYQKLVADISFPLQTGGIALKGGQGVLVAGSVIAKNTDDEFVLAAETASLTAHSVLTDDVDTGASGEATEVVATVYLSGVLNRKALVFGGTATAATHEAGLRTQGIYLKDVL